MQIAEGLKQAEQKLSDSESARLDVELLLCSVLECERSKLYAHPELKLTDKQIASFNELVTLRVEGQPIAHLIKTKEFWSLDLHITQDTLIPRPETERLVEATLALIPKNKPVSIFDLGTGSGAIAIALATERPLCEITATDKSEAALIIAKKNATKHNATNINFICADWFNLEHDDTYDLIVSNPPYISCDDPHLKQGDVRYESKSALISGKDGLDDIRTIIKGANKHLYDKGWLLLEHGYQQGNAVRQLLAEAGYNNVSTLKDYSQLERISMGQYIQ